MARIEVLAADTLGVRSLATLVESAAGTLVLIDPGAALAPRRFGLPPHPCEQARLEEALEKIRSKLLEAHIAIVTHYHYDHYLYRRGEEEFYHPKLTLIVKHPTENINVSQRLRAHRLLRRMGVSDRVAKIHYGDGAELVYEDVRIKVSPPLPHGAPGTPLGYVVAVLVEVDGIRVLHASDVQGPGSREALEWILSQNPDYLIISGPPTYLEGVKLGEEVQAAWRNLEELIARLPRETTVILDHHVVRDPGYAGRLARVRSEASQRGVKVVTAAEFMGIEPVVLENMRRELWSGEANCP